MSNIPAISLREAAYWIAGFVDGEGCIYHNKRYRIITTVNTDKQLIDHMATCCDVLGIGYRRRTRKSTNPKHKDRYILEIQKIADMARFQQMIPLRSGTKHLRLKAALNQH